MPTDLENGKNTGVRVEFKPTDHMAGGESTIVYEARNPSMDWEPYKPDDEWQRRFVKNVLGYDTESCVTFSGIRIIAMQLHFMLEKGLIPADVVQKMHDLGYFGPDGKLNFSEWFSANTNGTTEAGGNSYQGFWDGVRRDGLLPQSAGPAVNDFTKDTGGFLNASGLTKTQRDLAKQFLDLFDTPYQWAIIDESMGSLADFKYHLKQAPLHLMVPTCSTWNVHGEVGSCHVKSVNHAISHIGMLPDDGYKVLDHYEPFVKQLAPDYYVPYAVKAVVVLRKPPTAPAFHYTYTVNLKYGTGATTAVHALQQGLQARGYMQAGLFGVYGASTRAAVAMLQLKHNITDPDGAGINFGPSTRAALNAELM